MRTAIETVMARRQIDALIRSNPLSLVLVRHARVEAPGGGYRKGEPTNIVPQTVTLIPFKRRMTEFMVNTELGDIPNLEYVLLGYYNTNIMRGDTFTYNGEQFEVDQVEFEKDIRVAAAIIYQGGLSNG